MKLSRKNAFSKRGSQRSEFSGKQALAAGIHAWIGVERFIRWAEGGLMWDEEKQPGFVVH